jgi:hypothetical protein
MKNQNRFFSVITLLVIVFSIAFLNGCKPKCERYPNDPECLGENELLTTLKITFKDSATGTVLYTYQFKDADNNGVPEIFDTIRLNSNSAYKAELQFLNESVAHADDVTQEIEAEKNDHFIATSSTIPGIQISYIDFDNNSPPLPVGLKLYVSTTGVGIGKLRFVLRHQPGVKDGTITPGDTDMDVEFIAEVQ